MRLCNFKEITFVFLCINGKSTFKAVFTEEVKCKTMVTKDQKYYRHEDRGTRQGVSLLQPFGK